MRPDRHLAGPPAQRVPNAPGATVARVNAAYGIADASAVLLAVGVDSHVEVLLSRCFPDRRRPALTGAPVNSRDLQPLVGEPFQVEPRYAVVTRTDTGIGISRKRPLAILDGHRARIEPRRPRRRRANSPGRRSGSQPRTTRSWMSSAGARSELAVAGVGPCSTESTQSDTAREYASFESATLTSRRSVLHDQATHQIS
jgi:hypothetical protein